ncbi:MAG: DNA polymerase III subunit delta [Intestinimonas sp.]|jgi:DNA polymerase-3 subunit delta'|nr:DNA polymerase III subunit delta [Intestinimonas sp.]
MKRDVALEIAGRGLSHAYIISGPPGPDRDNLVRRLCAAYVCTGREKPCFVCSGCRKAAEGIHPDIVTVGLSDRDIGVDDVRALRASAYIRPNEAARKVYVLLRAQFMKAPAQNAMLKLLEDGPSYAAFLLVVENEGMLLSTIRSRCELIRMDADADCTPPDPDIVEAAGELAGRMLGDSELALMRFCAGAGKWERNRLAAVLDAAVSALRDGMDQGADVKKTLDSLEQVKCVRGALDYNMSAGQAAGWLCAKVWAGKRRPFIKEVAT